MLFGSLCEMRIKIFTHRSLDKSKKAIRPYRGKSKSNQVHTEINKSQSSPGRLAMAELGCSVVVSPADTGETGVHGGAWRGVVALPRARTVARSVGAASSTTVTSADHGGARRGVVVPWWCKETMGGILDRERRGDGRRPG
jgi:hypothetical protein